MHNRFAFSTLVCLVSVFSFCATSLPRQTLNANVKVDKTFVLPINKENLIEQLLFDENNTLFENLTDSLFYLRFPIPDPWAAATAIVKIKSLGDDKTIIQLDSIIEYDIQGQFLSGVRQSDIDACNNFKAPELEELFELNCIDILLQEKEKLHRLYLNRKILIFKYIN